MMELILFITNVFIVVTITVVKAEEESCFVFRANMYILLRKYLDGDIDTHATACLSKVITENSPISFTEYTDYLTISKNGPVPKVYNNSFSLMPNLKVLFMTDEQVDELESGAFNGLSNLRYLNLRWNNLQNLPQNVFDNVPNLVVLNLSYNKLTKIDRHLFDKLENLKRLALDYNRITELEHQWSTGLGNLNHLSLISNRLSKVKTMDYFGLGDLHILSIQTNNITIVERDGFKGLVNLKQLDMHSFKNKVVRIVEFDLKHELENMPKLMEMSLSLEAFECGVIPLAQEYLTNVSRTVKFRNQPESESCWEY